MSELILHHYDLSPYAEKARLMMGFKKLRWRSVQIPMVMPKPDLTALTGGYRLTPVLQVGADIYCDTKTIARRLEGERPAPTFYPAGDEASGRALAFWGETMFMDAVMLAFGLGVFPPEFIDDRQKMVPGGVDVDLARSLVPSKLDEIRAKTDLIESQLSDGRAYLLGALPSLADLSVYHPLWLLRAFSGSVPVMKSCRHIPAWIERVAAIGYGERVEMDSAEAVEIARAAQPATSATPDPDDPNGRQPGDRVQVFPEAYGRDPVVGELVACDPHEICIRRRDDRAGEVVVHFPREGYITLPA